MHTEALTEHGRHLFPLLVHFPDFYLAGGTSIALQIGHRVSVDFDFFSEGKIKKTLLAKVEEVFAGKKRHVLVNNPDELTLTIEGVKCTFLSYPFPVLLPTLHEAGVEFLALPELGATKAYTIGRRGELKDYIDMYFLLKQGASTLGEIIDLAQKKYGDGFDARLFFEQLVYFDDIEEVDIQFLTEPVSRETLKDFFEDEIRRVGI